MRTATRTRATLATLLTAALVALAATPTAAAAVGDDPDDPRLSDCNDAQCIVDAILGGLVRIVGAFIAGIVAIVRGIGVGFAENVLAPFLGVFGGFFGGVGAGLSTLGREFFEGAGDAMRASYEQMIAFFQLSPLLGPIAPVVAAGVILVVVAMVMWAVLRLFDKGTDILPEDVEEFLDDEDEDDE